MRARQEPILSLASAAGSIRTFARHAWPVVACLLLQTSAGAVEEQWHEAVVAGDYFGAGRAPQPAQTIEGDAFIAGAEIDLRVPVDGDAALSGGKIRISGRIGEDLYAAGGEVMLDAPVLRNARLAGKDIQLSARSDIAGRSTVAGRNVTVEGGVAGQLMVFGESVVLNGRFGSGVLVFARELSVGPDAVIQGRLTYRTAKEPNVSATAEIVGGMKKSDAEFDTEELRPWARRVAFAAAAVFSAGVFFAGLLAILLAPAATASVTRTINLRPWQSLLVGALLAIGIPFAAVLLMVTVIGIPVGVALMFAWPVLLLLGYLFGVMFMSDSLANLFVRSGNGIPGRGLRIGLFALVLIVLLVLGWLPILGWLIGVVLLWLGLGAIVVDLYQRRRAFV
jgi:hypothetical protein